MTKFTIYTEARANLKELAAQHFDAFTLVEGVGVWKGQAELSTQIVVLSSTPITDAQKVREPAAASSLANDQEAVLVTAEEVKHAYFVTNQTLGVK